MKRKIDTSGEKIRYRTINGCHILEDDYCTEVGIYGCFFSAPWGRLTDDGRLCLFARFPWDGASGPAIDRKENMRASCVHDGLYRAMREGLLPQRFRDEADEEYHRRLEEDGMSELIADLNHFAVEHFAASAARLHADPYPVEEAP